MVFHRGRYQSALLALMLLLVAGIGYAEVIVTAQYTDAVGRYGHFALGKPHEYAAVTAGLGNFSNHVYGSAELGLSTVVEVAGRMMLVVPDAGRRRLRMVVLADGRLVELGSCSLQEALSSALKPLSDGRIEIVGSPHSLIIDLKKCVH